MPEVRSCVITATGWSRQAVNDLPWPHVVELMNYWTGHPPAHLVLRMIAQGLGMKFKDTAVIRANAPVDPSRLSPAERGAVAASSMARPYDTLPLEVRGRMRTRTGQV